MPSTAKGIKQVADSRLDALQPVAAIWDRSDNQMGAPKHPVCRDRRIASCTHQRLASRQLDGKPCGLGLTETVKEGGKRLAAVEAGRFVAEKRLQARFDMGKKVGEAETNNVMYGVDSRCGDPAPACKHDVLSHRIIGQSVPPSPGIGEQGLRRGNVKKRFVIAPPGHTQILGNHRIEVDKNRIVCGERSGSAERKPATGIVGPSSAKRRKVHWAGESKNNETGLVIKSE